MTVNTLGDFKEISKESQSMVSVNRLNTLKLKEQECSKSVYVYSKLIILTKTS